MEADRPRKDETETVGLRQSERQRQREKKRDFRSTSN